MYRFQFPGDLFTEIDRLQRSFQRLSRPASSIRGLGRGDYPALNIGHTPESFEVYVFAPGLDPASIDLTIERGVMTISGERKNDLPEDTQKIALHINERYAGRFHRAVSLSEDADPEQVSANYNDGILHIGIKRHEAAKRRRIAIN